MRGFFWGVRIVGELDVVVGGFVIAVLSVVVIVYWRVEGRVFMFVF